jgi:hypothetical protein
MAGANRNIDSRIYEYITRGLSGKFGSLPDSRQFFRDGEFPAEKAVRAVEHAVVTGFAVAEQGDVARVVSEMGGSARAARRRQRRRGPERANGAFAGYIRRESLRGIGRRVRAIPRAGPGQQRFRSRFS